MKKYLKIILSYILLIIIMGAFIAFLMQRKDELNKLRSISLPAILLLSGFSVLNRGVNAFSSKKLMQAFGVDLSFKEWFGLACVANMSNYFLPMRSGVGARAFYMKNKYNFAYSHFLAAYLGLYMFSYIATAIFGILLILSLYLIKGILYTKILLVFLAVLIGAGGFMLSWKFVGRNNFRFKFANNVFEGLNYFRKQKKLLFFLLGLNFVSIIILALRFFVSFYAIGIVPGFAGMLILAAVIYFSFILSLTPSNLGIKETVMTIVAAVIGLSAIDGALAAVVDRSINFVITFILGIAFSILLFKELKFGKEVKLSKEDPTNEDFIYNA